MSIQSLAVLLVWGITCYLAGVLTGARLVHHKVAREVVVQVRDAWHWLRRVSRPSTFMAIALVLVGVQMFITQRQHNEDVARIAASAAQVKQLGICVATYENQLNAALQPRQHAAERLQAADQLFNDAVLALFAPGHNKADIARVRAAAQHKQDVAAVLTRKRAAKPYPKPPKEVCPQ